MTTKIVLLFAAVLFIFASNAFAAPESDQVAKVLKYRTNGNDAFLNRLLSPAKTLDITKSDSDRVQGVNNKIAKEIDLIAAAFNSAAEDKKVDATFAAANSIDAKLKSSNGANIVFVDGTPSAATSRNLILIPKKNSSITAASVTDILTSYKRSAKLSDYVYEYADVQSLTSGLIKTATGTETSWIPPEAATAFSSGKPYVLKKCRQLLGWRCVTSFYRKDAYLKSTHAFSLLFVAIVDLTQNPDHANFAGDKRSINQIAGSTAVYMVKESSKWVMIYGSETQWANEKLSFTGVIQKEFQKDFDRFKERLSLDLKISSGELF